MHSTTEVSSQGPTTPKTKVPLSPEDTAALESFAVRVSNIRECILPPFDRDVGQFFAQIDEAFQHLKTNQQPEELTMLESKYYRFKLSLILEEVKRNFSAASGNPALLAHVHEMFQSVSASLSVVEKMMPSTPSVAPVVPSSATESVQQRSFSVSTTPQRPTLAENSRPLTTASLSLKKLSGKWTLKKGLRLEGNESSITVGSSEGANEGKSANTSTTEPPSDDHVIVVPTREITVGKVGEDGVAKSKREYIIDEIIDSEEKYVESLRIISEIYEKELMEANIIPATSIRTLFGNVSVLYNINNNLYRELKLRTFPIGETFKKFIPFLRMYSSYSTNTEESFALLQKLKKTNPEFRKFLETQRAKHTDALTLDILDSLLIMPIQRLPRYSLLLSDLIKHTEESDPDLPLLKKDLDMLQDVTMDMNEKIKSSEDRVKFLAFTQTLSFSSEEQKQEFINMKQNHRFLCEFDCQSRRPKEKERKLMHCILYDDILVMVRKKWVGTGYELKCAIPLPFLTTTTPLDDETSIGILNHGIWEYYIYLSSAEEKKQRQEDIVSAQTKLLSSMRVERARKNLISLDDDTTSLADVMKKIDHTPSPSASPLPNVSSSSSDTCPKPTLSSLSTSTPSLSSSSSSSSSSVPLPHVTSTKQSKITRVTFFKPQISEAKAVPIQQPNSPSSLQPDDNLSSSAPTIIPSRSAPLPPVSPNNTVFIPHIATNSDIAVPTIPTTSAPRQSTFTLPTPASDDTPSRPFQTGNVESKPVNQASPASVLDEIPEESVPKSFDFHSHSTSFEQQNTADKTVHQETNRASYVQQKPQDPGHRPFTYSYKPQNTSNYTPPSSYPIMRRAPPPPSQPSPF